MSTLGEVAKSFFAGIGHKLYDKVLGFFNKPNVLMFAVVEKQDMYKAWGYQVSPQRLGSFYGKLKVPEEIPTCGFVITSIGDSFFNDILQSEVLVVKPFQVEALKMALKSRRLITAQCALVDGKEQGYIMLMQGDDGKMILSSFQARDYKTAEVLFYKVASEHVPQEAVLTVWFDHAYNKDNTVSVF